MIRTFDRFIHARFSSSFSFSPVSFSIKAKSELLLSKVKLHVAFPTSNDVADIGNAMCSFTGVTFVRMQVTSLERSYGARVQDSETATFRECFRTQSPCHIGTEMLPFR